MTTSSSFTNEEIDFIAEDVINTLSTSRNVGAFVNQLVSSRDYNNRSFELILSYVLTVMEHVDMITEAHGKPSIMERNGGYEEALTYSIKLAVAHYIISGEPNLRNSVEDQFGWELVDRQIELDNKYFESEDDVHCGQLSSKFSNQGNRRPTQNVRQQNGVYVPQRNQPNGGGHAPQRNYAQSGAISPQRNRPIQNQGRPNRTTGNVNKVTYKNPYDDELKANTQQYTPSNTRQNRPIRNENAPVRQKASARESYETKPVERVMSKPKAIAVVDHVKAKLTEGWVSCELFNPQKNALVYTIDDSGIDRKVEVRGSNVEKYNEHELGISPYNTDGRNGKVIPRVNLNALPPLGDDDNINENVDITVNPEIVVNCGTFYPELSSFASQLTSASSYTITPIRNNYSLTLPTSVVSSMSIDLKEHRTFNDWKKALDQIKRMINQENNVGGLLTTFISVLDQRLTNLVNSLLAVLVNKDANIKHFHADFDECWASINLPENASILTAWQDCQRALLAHAMKVVDVKPMTTEESLEVCLGAVKSVSDTEPTYTKIYFENKIIHVNAYGEVPQESLAFSSRDRIANVEFDKVPEFYTACDRIIAYRNNHCRMAQVILSDSFNNKYIILAGQSGETRIRATYVI